MFGPLRGGFFIALTQERRLVAAGKSFPVLRPFRWADPNSGTDTHYDPAGPNDTFTGTATAEMTSPDGPDGKGPLLGEEKSDKASTPTAASTSKEK
jgi:hypothetical protein